MQKKMLFNAPETAKKCERFYIARHFIAVAVKLKHVYTMTYILGFFVFWVKKMENQLFRTKVAFKRLQTFLCPKKNMHNVHAKKRRKEKRNF